MIIIYIDIILLVILLCLTVFTCGYCFYRVYTMQSGQIEILLRPRKVLFAHKNVRDSTEELRTVVAFQNPFTGDYCVRKSSQSHGYCNPHPVPPESPDSGLSDEYEPVHLEPVHVPRSMDTPDGVYPKKFPPVPPQVPKRNDDNSVNKTWNWNYTEYQI